MLGASWRGVGSFGGIRFWGIRYMSGKNGRAFALWRCPFTWYWYCVADLTMASTVLRNRERGLEDGIRSGALVELPSQTLGHTNPNLHFLYPEPKTPKPLNLKPQTLNL